jgi:hypothetical protein
MSKLRSRPAALVASLVAAASVALAGQPAPAGPTAAELKQNLARIARGTQGESVAFDRLVAATDKKLVAYLKAHEVSAAAASSLGLGYGQSPDSARLKIFSYTYSSGHAGRHHAVGVAVAQPGGPALCLRGARRGRLQQTMPAAQPRPHAITATG